MIMSRWVLGVMPVKKHMVTLHDYRKVPYLDWFVVTWEYIC